MIDSDARKIVSEAVRHFVSGQITNFEFENKIPSSKDSVISAVEDSLWCFYDDFKEHKINYNWEVPTEIKKMMARWILFLNSKEEYQWPEFSYPGIRPIEYGFIGKLLRKHKNQEIFMNSGDYFVWPFISRESYENAKKHPVLLAG